MDGISMGIEHSAAIVVYKMEALLLGNDNWKLVFL